MERMVVTRDVSQLSGWLKADAAYRGSQAGHTVRGGLRAGRQQEAAGERGAARASLLQGKECGNVQSPRHLWNSASRRDSAFDIEQRKQRGHGRELGSPVLNHPSYPELCFPWTQSGAVLADATERR